MRIPSTLPLVLLLALSSITRAAEQLSAPVAPYLDERTVLVARIDCDRMDIAAARKWVHDSTKNDGAQSQQFLQQADAALNHADKWLTDFRAAGGKTLFLVVSFGDTPGGSLFAMAPLTNGADAQKLESAMQTMRDNDEQKTAVINGAVFQATAPVLESLKQFKPTPRPDVETTLVTAGDVPIRIALAPSEDARRVIATLAQRLPVDLGGGPVTTLTDGVHSVSAGIKPPPDPSFLIRVQSKDAQSAQNFAGLLRQWIQAISKNERREGHVAAALLDAISPALEPTVEGDQVVIRFNSDVLASSVQQLPKPLIAARERAALLQSMSNVRQLLLGCYMYADARKGEPFPDSLEEMAKEMDMAADKVLTNPRDPSRHPAYIYIKPPPLKEVHDTTRRVVIYEAHDPGASQIVVGFADGHAEAMTQESFKKMLEAK